MEDPVLRDIACMYEKEKDKSKCFDFDDLLLATLRLFKKEPEFKKKHHDRVRHILVDEYQDTNHVQHALLKEMILDQESNFGLDSLCVVGDEDQSIYSWRGAVAGTMVTFRQDFPTADSLTLEQNYRSVQPILDTANELIKYNTLRKPKTLWSEKPANDRVRLLMCVSGYQEGEVVAELCKQYANAHNRPDSTINDGGLKHCAVLYRSHYQSRTIEEALVRHSIPYMILGGVQFYDRQEIKDLLAYLRLMANPFDRVAWLRAINTPHRGLGDKFQEQFIELWDQQPFLNFKELAATMIKDGLLVGTKREGLASFLAIFNHDMNGMSIREILEHIITASGYITYLKNSFEPAEAEERHDNVKELIHAVTSREEQGVTSLVQFLEEVALLQERTTRDNERDCVRLMTLHSAKGLEFNTVILTGLEEGILPSNHSLYNPDAIEEERRLLYVGITRAQERLLITYTRYRYTFGQMTDQRPSRFIKELMQSSHVGHHDATHWAQQHIAMYCKQWLQSAGHKQHQSDDNGSESPKKPAVKKSDAETKQWHVNQRVSHKLFGTGTVETIETKGIDATHLTIRFAEGIKKISAQFVKPE
jgi:DNA helicase-2/ATP-dependent DNA helicase PcrA